MFKDLFKHKGYTYLLDGDTKIPVCIETISQEYGEFPTFEGHFLDLLDLTDKKYTKNPAFEIKDVIFNNPATIVLWKDGTKTVVKCQPGDVYEEEVGLALCIAKKALGNKSNFNNVFKKWIPNKTAILTDFITNDCGADNHTVSDTINNFYENMKNFFGGK